MVLPMGWMKYWEKWFHVDNLEAMAYITDFYWHYALRGILWKRYVYAEHVKFIADRLDDEYLCGRSIYRSIVRTSDPGQVAGINWWIGWLYHVDPSTGSITTIGQMPGMTPKEFREEYKSLGGSGNF